MYEYLHPRETVGIIADKEPDPKVGLDKQPLSETMVEL